MYTCIYHDVDVRKTIGIIFSHCVSCLIGIHTMPHSLVRNISVAGRCIINVFCSYSKYPSKKAQTPLMRAPFTNILLLIDNGSTNNKQNTFRSHILLNMSTSCGGWPTLAGKICDIPWNTGSAGTLYTLISPLCLRALVRCDVVRCQGILV